MFEEQVVRREGGDPWDRANEMLLGRWCSCHALHHEPNRRRVLPLSKVPAAAVAFGVRLMGEDRAYIYLGRRYAA